LLANTASREKLAALLKNYLRRIKNNRNIYKSKYINKNMKKGWIYWTPRIISIIFILFLAMFSLDVFDSCNNFLNCFLGLLMHNIPVFILIIFLCIAWKYEIVGAIGFFLAGLLYIASIIFNVIKTGFEWYYLAWFIQISGIAFIVGILFLFGWRRKRKIE
jgi:hypothetical protein